MDEAVVSGTK